MTPAIETALKWLAIGAVSSLIGRIGFSLFPPQKDPTVTAIVSGLFFFGGIVVVLIGAVIGIKAVIERDRA